MITWALDSKSWDIGVDSNTKGISLKAGKNQIAQDIASSVRVFKGETPLDTTRGIAYNKPDEIRGSLVFEMRDQAKIIDGVSDVSVVFNKIENRDLDVTIYATTDSGEKVEVK